MCLAEAYRLYVSVDPMSILRIELVIEQLSGAIVPSVPLRHAP